MLRLAWRRLRGAKTHAIVMLLTVVLGVSANATVYSIVAGLLSRLPSGVQDPASLVQIGRGARADNLDVVSYPLFDAMRQHEGLGALAGFSTSEALVGSGSTRTSGGVQLVTGEFFDVLGVRPLLGRMLERRDERLSGGLVAVVSHEYWRRELSARADVVGSNLAINGREFTVVGVGPARFAGPDATARAPLAWIPVGAFAIATGDDPERFESPRMSWLRVVGRWPAEAPVERLQAMLAAALPAIDETLPGTEGLIAVRGVSALPRERVAITRIGGLLQALATLLLIITCANVAVLACVRTTTRRGDVAVELALGASRPHLLRAMLVEATLLATLAAVAAAITTVYASVAVRRLMPYDVAADFRPDALVLFGIGAVTICVTIVSNLGPALSVTGTRLHEVLINTSSRGATPGGTRLRQTLVAVQLCCCLVLVAVSIACVRSVRASANATPGFNAEGVFSASVRVSPFATAAERHVQWRIVRDRLAVIPGVESVGAAAALPLIDRHPSMVPFSLEALRAGAGRLPDPVTWTAIAGEYFPTLQFRMLSGRAFNANDDREEASPVAIVSRRLAERLFPGSEAVGQPLPFGEAGEAKIIVVGVVSDAQTTSLLDLPTGMLYYPMSQRSSSRFSVVVKTRTESAALGAAVLKVLHTASRVQVELTPAVGARGDQELLVERTGWLKPQVSATLRDTRLLGSLAVAFSVIALILAAVGVFGSLAFSVEQRRREFGVRMALGATPMRIVRQVLADALLVVGASAMVGLPTGFAAQRMVQGFLYETSLLDPLVVLLTLALLAFTAVLAACLPAVRAARTSAAVVLSSP